MYIVIFECEGYCSVIKIIIFSVNKLVKVYVDMFIEFEVRWCEGKLFFVNILGI